MLITAGYGYARAIASGRPGPGPASEKSRFGERLKEAGVRAATPALARGGRRRRSLNRQADSEGPAGRHPCPARTPAARPHGRMAQRRARCRRRRRPARSESCPGLAVVRRSQPGPPGRTSCCTQARRPAQLPVPAQPKAQLLESQDARYGKVAKRTPVNTRREASRSPADLAVPRRLLSRMLRDFPIRLPKIPPLGAAFRSMSTDRLGRSTTPGCLIGHTSRGCAQRRYRVKGMGYGREERGREPTPLSVYQRGSRRGPRPPPPPGRPPRSPPPPAGLGRASLTASFRPSSSVSFRR